MIKIIGGTIVNNGIGLAVGEGAEVEVDKTHISGNKIGVLEFASPEELNVALASLGFKPDVPREELRELLVSLRDVAPERRADILQKSPLLQRARNLLQDGVNTTANILSIVNSPQLQSLISQL